MLRNDTAPVHPRLVKNCSLALVDDWGRRHGLVGVMLPRLLKPKLDFAKLERRSERVGEIAHDAGLYADSLLDELAARKLRFHHPNLALQWDALQQQQRKAALQNLQASQTVEFDVGRTRSLTFSSDS